MCCMRTESFTGEATVTWGGGLEKILNRWLMKIVISCSSTSVTNVQRTDTVGRTVSVSVHVLSIVYGTLQGFNIF